jgi:2-iminobutanoate/2-iminopropanoate deaminase
MVERIGMRQAVGAGVETGGGYSPGIVGEGRFVFVSGQCALRDGVYVSGSIGEETRSALENLRSVLISAGSDLEHVVECRVFLADIADFQAMDIAYSQVFPDPMPARTTIGANLTPGRVEISCIALIPTSSDR